MLPIPVSKTKIIPPRRRDELLLRKRLQDMLFDALDKKLTLVSAPAGYGKTSILIDLTKHSELKCCWFSIDELDREPQRFIAYLVASIAERFPGFGGQTMAILRGLSSLEHEMERIAVTLVNEAFDLIKEHFVIIFDDFHILEGVQPIYDLLNRFTQLVDDNCHIIISSRTLTSLSDLPLMVAHEQVGGLNFSDLAFQTDEIQALILQNYNVHVADQDAQKLIDESEGWITGLQFLGDRFTDKEITRPRFASKTGVDLFDYLGQQVMDRQKPEIREFLLRTSLMDEFDAELCHAVLTPFYKEKQDWNGYIKAVTQNNLFALPVGADGRFLRYHHLFRDYLRTQLEKERPAEVRPILERLIKTYESKHEWEKAHFLIKKIGDMNLMAEVIEQASHNNLHRMLPIVEHWLEDLPPSVLRNHPGALSVAGGVRLARGDSIQGIALLDQAIDSFHKNKNNAGLAMALIRRSRGYRSIGDYSSSTRDIDQAIALTNNDDSLESLRAEALRTKGINLIHAGQTRLSLEMLEMAYKIILRLNQRVSIPDLLMEIGVVYHNLGDYLKAEKNYLDAMEIWKQDANIWAQCTCLNNLGNLYHQMGEYEKSAQFYEEGLICCQRSGDTRAEILITIGLGDLHTELQDFESATKNYQHAETLFTGKKDQYLLLSLKIGEINLALLQDDLNTAEHLITAVQSFVKMEQSHYENGFLDAVYGKLNMMKGKFSEAVSAFEGAGKHFKEDGHELEFANVQIWLVAALWAANNRDYAYKKIMELLENGKVPHLAIVAVGQARRWLDGLQKDSLIGKKVRELFSKAEKLILRFPAVQRELRRHARIIEAPAPRLFIQGFGHSNVHIDEKELSLSDWQTQSVKDLFFFFLVQSRPLTKEQIAEKLWPEIDEPSKIRLRFKNEMYRLRRAVGNDVIYFENPVYYFNRKLNYEYDVEAFESFISRAKSVKNTNEQIRLYRKAIDLVKGPFLDDIYFDWTLADRDRLTQVYLSALLTLADLYYKQAMLDESLTMCQRATEFDAGNEAACSLSMQVYQRLNDRPAIIRTYHACAEALKQFHGLAPSKETYDLYLKLIA